jgi:hypothetical protein
MNSIQKNKCYCLEIFRKKFGPEVQGKCLEMSCGRYRIEMRKLNEVKNGDETNGKKL